ncbi:MAG: Mrp/NBP35 family ATP-binding protein [Candidatus Bipolaricaulota bacterium]
MKQAKHVLMVMSGKGGVGKTTVAVNVAAALARSFRVGLFDADLHGPNAPKMLGIEGATMSAENGRLLPVVTPQNLYVVSIAFGLPDGDAPVIWRGPLKMKAIQQFIEEVAWGELDLLVVDLPPGTGDEPLSVVQVLGHVDAALIVTTPQEVALLDARKAVRFARQVGVNKTAIVENMSVLTCPHCGGEIELFGQGGGERMAAQVGARLLGRLPILPDVVKQGDAGTPPVLAGGPVGVQFATLAERVWEFVIAPTEATTP